MWSSLPDAKKKKYVDESERNKAEYQKGFEEWVAKYQLTEVEIKMMNKKEKKGDNQGCGSDSETRRIQKKGVDKKKGSDSEDEG